MSSSPSLPYRRDIDGLRALAVLAVVLFHTGAGVEGGFVGVDVFFVVSGYLITSIIVADLAAQRFSLIDFYERRIRRIVPALVAMMVATSVAAVILLPPDGLADFGKSAAAGSLFSANLYFARNTGYFARAGEEEPLLHLWSLGVEEQFYVLWPLLLLACWRWGWRSRAKGIAIGIAATSLACSEWLLATGQAADAFFLPQSRAWELMLGAGLALGVVPQVARRSAREILGLVGLALVVLSCALYARDMSFPGLRAALPCLGAALLIHTGSSGNTIAARLLGFGPLVWIGLISYSLYLWHWPILVFAKGYLDHSLAADEIAAVIALSIAVAALSWRYVEQPFRKGNDTPRAAERSPFAAGLGSLTALACLGAMLFWSDGLPGRLDAEERRFAFAHREINPLQETCHADEDEEVPRPLAACARPAPARDTAVDIVLWGDSHGDALFPAVSAVAARLGLSARQVTKSGCPPLIGAWRVGPDRMSPASCPAFNRNVMRLLEEGPRPRLVVLAGRWSLDTETRGAEGRRSFLVDAERRTSDAETSRRVLDQSLRRTVDALGALGIPVLLVGQAPEFGDDPNLCLLRKRLYDSDASGCITRRRQAVQERMRASTEILTRVANGRSRVLSVDLAPLLCDADACWARKDGRPLYVDDDHLGLNGARLVGAALASAVLSLLGPARIADAPRTRDHHALSWHSGRERE